MFSGKWRKAEKRKIKKERKQGLFEFPRPLNSENGGMKHIIFFIFFGLLSIFFIRKLPPVHDTPARFSAHLPF